MMSHDQAGHAPPHPDDLLAAASDAGERAWRRHQCLLSDLLFPSHPSPLCLHSFNGLWLATLYTLFNTLHTLLDTCSISCIPCLIPVRYLVYPVLYLFDTCLIPCIPCSIWITSLFDSKYCGWAPANPCIEVCILLCSGVFEESVRVSTARNQQKRSTSAGVYQLPITIHIMYGVALNK